MKVKKDLMHICSQNIDELKTCFSDEAIYNTLGQIADVIISALKKNNKVLICGNGGSAADAQHIAGEFIGRFKKERKSFPAIALTTDSSILTCVGNDYGFDEIFKRQVEGLAEEGDVLIGISTSGNSKNVLRAFEQAKKIGVVCVSFTGSHGGELKSISDLNCNISSRNTPYIQSGHIIALHALCEVVEKELIQ